METEKTGDAANDNGIAPNRRAMRGLAMELKRIDGQRNGKAKIPRRRNPAERKIIWQSLKLEIELR